MSGIDISERKGMPFGGMPTKALLMKLEETDPDFIDEVRGNDDLHDIRDDYNEYARGEIIDWTPSAPFLESDHARRDPGLSRSMINLRYNGTRGSRPELPRHPEMFIGFTGNDPRGADEQPRFDQMRAQVAVRMANLEARMGSNNDMHIAERPWTGPEFVHATSEMHRRIRDNTKVFTPQKTGRPWGRNVVTNELTSSRHRRQQTDYGAESMEDDSENMGNATERFAAGDHSSSTQAVTSGIRGVDTLDGDTAPWRNTKTDADMAKQYVLATMASARQLHSNEIPWKYASHDADMPVQQYGQTRNAGRTQIGAGAQGGGKKTQGKNDQDLHQYDHLAISQSANRQTLAATMALAVKSSKANRDIETDTDYGKSQIVEKMRSSNPLQGKDVAMVYRQQQEDGARHTIADGQNYAVNTGLFQSKDLTSIARQMLVSHTSANPQLANVSNTVRGLKEATSSMLRKAANQSLAAGARHLLAAEMVTNARSGLLPSKDLVAITRHTELPVYISDAAGMEVHTYKSAPLEAGMKNRREGKSTTMMGHARESMVPGKSAEMVWRSHTEDPVVLGDAANTVFGFDAEVGDRGVPNLPKTVRPTEAGEEMMDSTRINGA